MRAKRPKQRVVLPDPKFGSTKITKLINRSMRDGKKNAAQKQVYAAIEMAAAELKMKPVEMLDDVLAKITPQMEVRSRRVGGAAYQVPMPVRTRRGSALAIRWLVTEANRRPNKQFRSYAEKLAAEMVAAYNEEGGAINRRDASHKMAEANKAFAHFRW